jgi:hypothetical protein
MRKNSPITLLLLAAVFLFGAAARWHVFQRNTQTNQLLTGDAAVRYLPLAEHIATRGEFSIVPGVPDTFNQPLYPLFLVPFRAHLRWAVAIQMLLELAIIPLVWQVTKALGGSPLVASCILWAFPVFPRWFSLLCTEALATLFAALLLWALVRGTWLWAGVLAGLCILTRGDMILAVGLMFVAAIVAHRSAPKTVALAVLALLATILPWSLRTHRVAGTFNFVTGVSGQTREPYVRWMDSWADNEFCIEQYWWLRPLEFPERLVPDASERRQALAAAAYDPRPQWLPAQANTVFDRLAQQRREQHPLHTLIGTRIQRPFACWASLLPASRNFVVLSAGGIVMLGLCMYALLRPRGALWIAGALLLARSLLPLISILGSETRYLVEAMPAAFPLCSVALCRLFYARRPSVMPREEQHVYAA